MDKGAYKKAMIELDLAEKEVKATDTAWTRPGYAIKMPDGITYKVADSILVDNVLTVVFLPLPDHATIDSGRSSYVKDMEKSADEYKDDK